MPADGKHETGVYPFDMAIEGEVANRLPTDHEFPIECARRPADQRVSFEGIDRRDDVGDARIVVVDSCGSSSEPVVDATSQRCILSLSFCAWMRSLAASQSLSLQLRSS